MSRIDVKAAFIHPAYPLLYIATRNSTLLVYNITSLSAPVHVSTTSLPGFPTALAVRSKTTLFVGTWEGKLLTYNVKQPSLPVFLSQITLQGGLRHITLFGNTAYIASDEGVNIVDTADPKRMKGIGKYRIDGDGAAVMSTVVSGSTLYAAATSKGLQLFDISPKGELSFVTSLEGQGVYGYDVFVEGNTAYLASGPLGLVVLKVDPCRVRHPSILKVKQDSGPTPTPDLVSVPMGSSGFSWENGNHTTRLDLTPQHAMAYIPRTQPVPAHSVYNFTCPDTCDQTPCEIFVSHYHCPHCPTTHYPDILLSQGWVPSPCTPTVVTDSAHTPLVLTTYKKTVLPGDAVSTPPTPPNLAHLLFFHKTADNNKWCQGLQQELRERGSNEATCQCL
eukprot:TRINITY_DN1594_c0_g2_i1.p1 TRINITY_DN1594_c0_g2~~TRINITY_DN1594_c0_g2_i1.p1  ORF type:complete len:423 (+),score=128.45 TRINITY_DN1594_c0_g2_i1:98-1270(+)